MYGTKKSLDSTTSDSDDKQLIATLKISFSTTLQLFAEIHLVQCHDGP